MNACSQQSFCACFSMIAPNQRRCVLDSAVGCEEGRAALLTAYARETVHRQAMLAATPICLLRYRMPGSNIRAIMCWVRRSNICMPSLNCAPCMQLSEGPQVVGGRRHN